MSRSDRRPAYLKARGAKIERPGASSRDADH